MTDRQFSFGYVKSFLILPLHDEKYFLTEVSSPILSIKLSHKITTNYLFIILNLSETL